MRYGIYNIEKVSEKEEIVLCNNCENYYYDEINDERNNNSLAFFLGEGEFFKGCPFCKTDSYLTDIIHSKQ